MANLKEVLRLWEEENKTPLGRAIDVNLSFRYPPLQKLDGSLSMLVSCEKLSLSTNQIEKLAGFQKLKSLKILSIGRNNLRDLLGLEAVAETLEQLWMSYNQVDKLKGINVLIQLKVLYMSYNNVRDWAEFQRLAELPQLKELNFLGNPLVESMDEEKYRTEVGRRLANLKILDGMSVIRDVN